MWESCGCRDRRLIAIVPALQVLMCCSGGRSPYGSSSPIPVRLPLGPSMLSKDDAFAAVAPAGIHRSPFLPLGGGPGQRLLDRRRSADADRCRPPLRHLLRRAAARLVAHSSNARLCEAESLATEAWGSLKGN